jgi:hypothetical protein
LWPAGAGPPPRGAIDAVLSGHDDGSRATYVEFVTDERVETLIEAHENAFLAFGGTPREVLYDNMRTVVLERHRYGPGRHRFHPGFLDFARHCGFRPRLCAPYRAQTKGKVERFIRDLRESFYVPLASRLAQEGLVVDRETANLAVRRWLREVANARVHGTTGEIPAERLALERTQLQPVPTPMAAAASARFRMPSRCRSSGCSTRCQCTTSLPAAANERFAAPAHAELYQELRLTAIPNLYPTIAQSAAAKDASFADFLEETLRAERDARGARAREMFGIDPDWWTP